MLQGLLPLRLNCPWRATATTAMVRSSMLGQSAPIGVVQLVAPPHASSSSTVPLPIWTTTLARSDSLCVVLRIDTLIH